MNQRIAIFAGPSLPPSARPDHANLTWLPPAAAGDALRLIDQDFDCVCLIDGYFDHRPAPWHKELLALLEKGVRLIGASSMGALRAAELDRFGMEGVGKIYRAYRDGRLTGDDEVALIHAPESLGWAAASVPMVELRATLALAIRRGLITVVTARLLRAIGQDLFYADRDWPLLLNHFAEKAGIDPETGQTIAALHVPLKQQDAEDCVAVALSDGSKPPPICVPRTSFLAALMNEISAP